MWSRRGILKSLVVAGGAVGLGTSLAGCGFRPMYGTASGAAGTRVDQQMAEIHISPIADRQGQQLHNALRDRFNPLGQPSTSAYTLDITQITRTYGALARRDLSASRRNVQMNASYVLRDSSGNVVLNDRAVSTTGYDEFDDPLNDISAYEDAVRRNTLQLADQIRTRVAVYLTSGTPPTKAAAQTSPAAPADSQSQP